MALDGKTDDAREQFENVAALATAGRNAFINNDICRIGSLHGFAREVMEACERAVELAKVVNREQFLDTRGVARAITGDLRGARKDFEEFIPWARNNGYGELADKRDGWVKQLDKGKNPFDDLELRRQLLNE